MLAFSDPILLLSFFAEWSLILPFIRRRRDDMYKLWMEITAHLTRVIDEHEARNDYKDENFEPSDFIDAYLFERAKLDAKGEAHYYE